MIRNPPLYHSVSTYTTDYTFKNGTISTDDILERSICAEKDWEVLGQTLEVKEDMKKIKDECYNQAPVCRKELMRHWFKTKGQNVTATQLDTVLPPSTEEKSSKFKYCIWASNWLSLLLRY